MKGFSLLYKFIALISIITFSVLLFFLTYFYEEFKDSIEIQTQNYLTSIAEAVEGQIYLFFDRVEVRVGDWSSDGYIRQMTEKILKDRNPQDVEALNRYFIENKVPLNHSVKLLEVISPQREIVASSEPRRVGIIEHEHITPERKEEVLKAKYGEIFIEKLEEENGEHEEEFHPMGMMFHAMTPIKSIETGETIGILLFHYNADMLNEILSGEWQIQKGAATGQEFIKRFQTSEIYLVNKDKLLMSPLRFANSGILKQKINTVPIGECLENNKEFNGEYLNYLGKLSYGASMCLSQFNAVLIVEIQSDEALALITKEKNHLIIITFILWILSVLISFLIIRIFLKNLIAISKAAEKIIKGDYNIQLNIKSTDEIGKLASVFNHMIESIKISKNELSQLNEELKKTNTSLEIKVKERTQELEEIKIDIEKKLEEATKELENRLQELEKFKQNTIDREFKMIELKKELEELRSRCKDTPPRFK